MGNWNYWNFSKGESGYLPIRLLLLCIGMSSIFTGYCYGEKVSALPHPHKFKMMYTAEWKTYSLSETEPISLYGAKRRYFLTPEWYWGEAGYGAVSGKRSGYLEGGVITGFLGSFFDNWVIDCRFFIGAGGGGSAPQGGGFLIHPTIGIGWQWTPSLSALVEWGYIRFLNGNISSWTMAVTINLSFWEVEMME